MKIIQAGSKELPLLTELFNLYRIFYHQQSEINGANEFLKKRIENGESVIFLAFYKDEPVGFTQLYPSFSSISMKKSWILNDLYVKEIARKQGFGEALIKSAIQFARETDSKGLLLQTDKENTDAQRLYEKVGFKKETSYFYYFFA